MPLYEESPMVISVIRGRRVQNYELTVQCVSHRGAFLPPKLVYSQHRTICTRPLNFACWHGW